MDEESGCRNGCSGHDNAQSKKEKGRISERSPFPVLMAGNANGAERGESER